MISIKKNINHWLTKRANPILMEAAREMVRQSGYGRGSIINNPEYLDTINKIFQMEKDRMSMYQDGWLMLQESPLVDQANNGLSQDATGQPFKVVCDSNVHEKIAYKMFERTKYWYYRTMLLGRALALGDIFLKLDIDTTFGIRRIGQIEEIRVLPEFTMHRNTDFSGQFINQYRAFTQRSKPVDFMVDVTYSMSKPINFNAFEVLHSRYNHLKQPNPKYGVSGYNSARIQYGAVQSMMKDMVIARHNGTFNRLLHEVDQSVGSDDYEKYRESVKAHRPTPTEEHVVKGIKISAIDQKNNLLSNIDDLRLAIDVLKVGLQYPFELFGFGEATGEQLEKMESRQKRTISFLHRFEEYEIVRPMLDREFLLHGYKGVEYKIINPPISFEDENKTAKKQLSKVQGGTMSRRRAIMDMENLSLEEAEAELDQMKKELEEIGTVGKYQPPGESLEKGKKGVETKETENQDISDVEGTTNEE